MDCLGDDRMGVPQRQVACAGKTIDQPVAFSRTNPAAAPLDDADPDLSVVRPGLGETNRGASSRHKESLAVLMGITIALNVAEPLLADGLREGQVRCRRATSVDRPVGGWPNPTGSAIAVFRRTYLPRNRVNGAGNVFSRAKFAEEGILPLGQVIDEAMDVATHHGHRHGHRYRLGSSSNRHRKQAQDAQRFAISAQRAVRTGGPYALLVRQYRIA